MLTQPCAEYIKSYIEFCIEYKKNNLSDLFLNSYSVSDLEKILEADRTSPIDRAQALLCELNENSLETSATTAFVPASQFWLVDNGEVVGVGDIRHYLTPALEFYGGHIGYGVKLGCWGRGYGTLLLKALLEAAQIFRLKTALLTCAATNPASRHVMEKNGAVLLDTSAREIDGMERLTHRLLIDTGLALNAAFPFRNHAMLYQAESDKDMLLMPFKAVDEGGRIVSYYFNIAHKAYNIGWIVFRVADEPWLYYDGNIGYFVKPEYRGNGYTERACRMLGAKLKRLGLERTVITCDSDNTPSRRVCQSLGAKFLELALQTTSTGRKLKCRYVWRLDNLR